MTRKKSLLVGILTLALFMVGIPADFLPATGFGSQYLASWRASDECGPDDCSGNGGGAARQIKIRNMGNVEMFALWIQYDRDRNFDSCEGQLIPANVRTEEDPMCCVDSKSYNEIIAVPSIGPLRGLFHPTVGVQAWRGTQGKEFVPGNPVLFRVLSPDVVTCACSELADQALPRGLLVKFGIRCPA